MGAVDNPMMNVQVYTNFHDLPQGYIRLFEESSFRSIFYSIPWFENFMGTVLGENDGIRIYGAEPSDPPNMPVAALAMQCKNLPRNVFTSSRLTGLSNFYTLLFGPVLDIYRPDLHEIIYKLVHAICSDIPYWNIVDLHPLDAESVIFTELVKSFKSMKMIVQTYFCFGNWYLKVNGISYLEYFETLPSAMKNTVRRKSKKLENSGRARIEIITDTKGLNSAIKEYEKVYNASWKVPEPYPLFMPGLIRTCAERGWLRLGLAYIDGEPAAAQLWTVNGGIASIYKLAYDERFAKFSVGTALTARLMEHVINIDHVREVDYLSGDDPYKKSWMSHRRERWGIIAFNPWTMGGGLGILRHVGGRALKAGLQELLRR